MCRLERFERRTLQIRKGSQVKNTTPRRALMPRQRSVSLGHEAQRGRSRACAHLGGGRERLVVPVAVPNPWESWRPATHRESVPLTRAHAQFRTRHAAAANGSRSDHLLGSAAPCRSKGGRAAKGLRHGADSAAKPDATVAWRRAAPRALQAKMARHRRGWCGMNQGGTAAAAVCVWGRAGRRTPTKR